MKFPMKEKYIDERMGQWIIFGTHTDGTVDVHDSVFGRDIFDAIPKELAEKVVQAHDEFREKIYSILNGGNQLP